ncbi:protein angel isoform X2 [Chelonus insularis]|uniref:protein angel isoform X2 n=1 Tax=Chelonus insularis TaxID=460826 RepID=UPI00158A8C28|nr:protein angel isoform X2 [Chelonus insularis]
MVPTTKLLTTVSLANVVGRYIHTGLFQQEFKIFHMSEASIDHLLFENHSKSISNHSEVFYSTYNTITPQYKYQKSIFKGEYLNNKTKMEPMLNQCIGDSSNDCSSVSNTRTEPSGTTFVQEIRNDINNLSQKFQYGISRRKYKELRPWITLNNGTVNKDTDFILRILSYNILAQNLLETHSYLYRYHHPGALDWNIRKPLIQKEILEAEANVICIQEMQLEHLKDFLIPFIEKEYDYLYKKRTNNTKDGLLLLYKPKELQIENYVYVEYHQTSTDILNRDNVGIVVKFSLKESPNTFFVISTTHLLYNPKRNDVRLAQTQILFSEIERIAFIENTESGPSYYPIIVCGDFNLQPFTGVYNFITKGSFHYVGKGQTLENRGFMRLSNCLIPSSLLVTDNCQHFNVLTKRLRGVGSEKIMLSSNDSANKTNGEIYNANSEVNEVDVTSRGHQEIKIIEGKSAHFSSGVLTHPFKFSSVYQHNNWRREMEATTNQGQWITVDYIFFTDVEPLNRYTLPTVSECETLPLIPNFTVGSDHLCLGATFKLKKKQIMR